MGLFQSHGRYGRGDGETDLMDFTRITDLDVRGKRLLVRADLNVPFEDHRVTDRQSRRTGPAGTERQVGRGGDPGTHAERVGG